MSNQQDSPAWIFFQYVSFAVALLMMVGGIFILESNVWMKGYLAMATILIVNSSITLSKTLRDNFETKKLHNRIEEARQEKLLKDYEADVRA